MHRFLFYIDQNTKKGIKKRERINKRCECVEETLPLNAPDWTISGYNGPLKDPTFAVTDEIISRIKNQT